VLFSKAYKTPLETLIAEAQADPDAELLLPKKKSRDTCQPQVGDVVECRFKQDPVQKAIVAEFDGKRHFMFDDGMSNAFCFGHTAILRKIGETDVLDSVLNISKGLIIAEKYFAKEATEPTFTGTYAERQAQWVEHHGLKVGDKVKVVREYTKDEDGFGRVCAKGKDDAVGKTLSVIGIDNVNGAAIKLSTRIFGSEWFPYFVLEPVKE
jgi:hypothetical protein